MAWELRARYNVNKPSIAGEEQRQGRGKEGEKDWVERRRKLSKGPGGDKRIMHRQQQGCRGWSSSRSPSPIQKARKESGVRNQRDGLGKRKPQATLRN